MAQLATDLLLENISGMTRVGYIEHDGLLPMVGNGGEGEAAHLLTALEGMWWGKQKPISTFLRRLLTRWHIRLPYSPAMVTCHGLRCF